MFFMRGWCCANFLLLFVGWEGVDCAATCYRFLLLRKSAADAARRRFFVNRSAISLFARGWFRIMSASTRSTSIRSSPRLKPAVEHTQARSRHLPVLMRGAAGTSAQVRVYVGLRTPW